MTEGPGILPGPSASAHDLHDLHDLHHSHDPTLSGVRAPAHSEFHMRSSALGRTRLALGVGLAVVATGLSPVLAQAAPDGSALVISEVYGGGGNTGATYTHDFIELYNPTASAISVDGMSVQYRSSGNSGTGVTPLAGTVPAHGHYLVQQAKGTGGTTPLPDPDATGSIAMSGSSGIAFLAQGTAAVTLSPGTSVGQSGVVDLVGFGASPAVFETVPTGVNLTSNTSATRVATGVDTDNNADDFSEVAPDPQASGGQEPPEDPPGPVTRTIAEIQGTGAVSPVAGQVVTTKGVVVAAYPTGGFNGFYIQTPGSTPGAASHGLFVYGYAATQKVAVGDYVQVTGEVTEFRGLTEITPASAADVQVVPEVVAPVEPAAVPWPDTDAERERLEGMLLAPQGPFTVTDTYDVNTYAELALAAGDSPLRQPTDVAPLGSPEADAVAQRNAADLVTLDDGASINFLGADANKDIPLPWLTDDPTIRTGEPVTFVNPVVLDYRFDLWRLQPQAQLTAGDINGVLPATFGDTRTHAPDPVGGDLQVASFNVLNYFATTGDSLSGCRYYTDRDADPVTVSGGCDARGAAELEDLERQQSKIVEAINALGAEVVSLEEIENSAYFGKDRDAALAHLVEALNDDLGRRAWRYVPSPTEVPSLDREDVIRTAFIYKRAAVKAQGESFIYDGAEFDRARDPLAQRFMPVGGNAKDKFLLIVNHFKSKGSPPSNPQDPNADHGQGAWNPLRVTQAEALVRWADELKELTGIEKVYLDGDFNSYTFEDPMQVLYDAGYASLEREFDAGHTYVFDGKVGSLDHALANEAALGTTTGADVWNINSVESVALEYSRFNYNATNFYDGSTPFRSSDHDPVVFGVDVTRGR